MNKKGVALIVIFGLIVVLTILCTAILSSSIAECNFARRNFENSQAFWLAESGISKALVGLKADYNLNAVASTALGAGGYSAAITPNADGTRTVTAQGFVPFGAPFHANRILQAVMNKLPAVPNNFYDNAIYSSGNINISGNSYEVTGNVIYAGTISSNTSHIAGTISQDPSIAPLALLNFDQLRLKSQEQGNYHDSAHLNGPFPTSFWYNEDAQIPNVVFLEGNLDLSGKTLVGGFFVVGGEVTYDATLSGNVSVDGCIYSRGTFTINGGGNALNVNGGVWAGSGAVLNGHAKLDYNGVYMQAIHNLNIDTDVQVLSWQDTQDPYPL